MASGAGTKRTSPGPTRKHGSCARAGSRKRVSASAGICSPRTETASSWTPSLPRRPATPNGRLRFGWLHASRLARGDTLGADKAYDTADFVAALTERGITPHVAQHTRRRRSAVADAIANTPAYAVSQRRRKLVEECFGWCKTVAGSRKLRYLGVERNQHWFQMLAAGYNLVRMLRLAPTTA